MITSSSRHLRRELSHYRYCLIIGTHFIILLLYREKKRENENVKMKCLINRRCNERNEIIIAIHMYIRSKAERIVAREGMKGIAGREIENISRRYYWSL